MHRGSQEHFRCVFRNLAVASGNGAHCQRSPPGKNGQDMIEPIQLLEGSGVVERRASSDHRTPRNLLRELEGNGQGVLPTLRPPHDSNRPHLKVVKERHEVSSDPREQTMAG